MRLARCREHTFARISRFFCGRQPGLPGGAECHCSLFWVRSASLALMTQPLVRSEGTLGTPLTLLVIEDEPQIRRILRTALASQTTRIVEANDGMTGLDLAVSERPQLVVLDLGLPDMSGVEVCKGLRRWTRAPILVVSARHSDSEKVALLDAGADDYVTKPFSTSELRARVRALLRRAAQGETTDAATRIESGDLVIDLVGRTLLVHGE